MVTITNGIKAFRVTTGAVETYKHMGFHVAENEELEETEETPKEQHENSNRFKVEEKKNDFDDESGEDVSSDMSKEDMIFVEELLEKPLSQWTNEEVKEFARIKNIDTTGVQKVSQARSIIKTYLEEQNKNA